MNADDRLVLPGARDARDPARSLTAPGVSYTREQVAAIQRERMMDAVVQLSDESGFENTGIKAICARAGVGLATFYEHFPNKDDLLLAAFDVGVRKIIRAVAQAYTAAADQGWETAFDACMVALLRATADNPAFSRFYLVEIHKSGRDSHARVHAALESSYELFANAEMSAGMPTPDPQMVPLVVGGIYTRLAQYVRTGRAAEVMELRESIVEFSLSVFGEHRRRTAEA
ncbi:TetR/AcrR family transcriptional regulator [Nocardioides marmoriginsengisoli]|uniref:TetR/AcrR family transcriptional regulator n=1 Tax=Nocardioides marmoriginsengisoli TaxID=661483 RepID=A0A3N0CFM4_9ACTN|nr:TetR/AcrR family transcriptional regulator [Nocardioides marmoriginsengisoli]RNL62267.1 TetR/AcrR family transcriptional regulator [Nocardioides marmoriginsengisoli]